ncbi:ATP-dependent DNA ligase [archaeon]|nr:ATP-dependent DNA ligase [archaeon]MBT6606626.1 ATP-dependent DNA ligase [archaeon]MBT7251869.1 ATP-dependent DNA ligase [archaeon]
MDYSKLCETYHALESTTKGLEKTQILADFLELIKNPETIYLLQGKVFAEFNNREMGISHQLAIRAIARAVGIGDKEVLESFKELGDLGKVAEKLLGEQKKQTALFTQKLKIEKVMNSLRRITTLEGTGTVDLKLNLIVDLFHSASPLEAKYIMRTVLSDLKIGVGAGILRDAVVVHCFKPESIEEKKEYVLKVQEAYDKTTDWREVFEKSCSDTLNTIELKPGRPLKVMLFPKAANITDAFRIVGEPAAFEYKYDGFRVMINKDEKGKVKIFTRRLEEVTVQFPEIVDYVTNNVNGKNFIIDGEAVGFDSETKKYTAFQAISQRIRRKYGIESMMKRFPVELVLFDIIYHEGRSLIEVAFEQRRELLKKIVKVEPYKIILSKQIITSDERRVNEFYELALGENQEGLMAKSLSAPYKPGSRIGHAVKLKPEDNDFDLVITGAEWGTGKRAGWLTSYNVSCKNNGDLLEIGKVSTGLKELEGDELSYNEMTKKLQELETHEDGRTIKVQPKIIVTVQYQDIQKSTNYASGFALRFPRIKALRPDRGIDDIATVDEVRKEVEE